MTHSMRTGRPAYSAIAIAIAIAGGLALHPTATFAGGSRTWTIDEHKDFDKGETSGAAIEASGRVTVGFLPARGTVAGTAAFTCLSTEAGVVVGTADPATVLRVVPGKRKAQPKKKPKKRTAVDKATSDPEEQLPELVTREIAKLDGVVVSAMVELPGGDLVVATLPGGKLTRIDKRGKQSVFAELKVTQIWRLLVHDGRLLIATGPEGELWSTTLAGKDPKVVFDADEKDILSLVAVGRDVVVGVAPQARLYRVTKDLEGELLHDFSGDEVRDLALTKTGLVAVINEFDDRKITSVDALTKNLDRTSLVGQPPSGTLSGDSKVQASAQLVHVDLGPKRDLNRATEAPWEVWLDKDKQYFTSVLALDQSDTVLVSSSDDGKVYRVRGLRDVSTVADLEERQATGLCHGPKQAIVATAGQGSAVYELAAMPARQAKYISEVFNAKQPAHFGAVRVRGRGALTLRARSGPTEEPGRRWSGWKPIALSPETGALRGELGVLGQRRFIQLEVGLSGATTEVRGLEVFYAPENLAPLLTTLKVERGELGDDESDAEVTVSWKADARDDDDLIYDVRVRPEGASDDAWIPLGPRDELLTKRELKWDLATVPDGTYEVEVIASDEPTNGSARALQDALRSGPVVVDRKRPTITEPKIVGDRITATANDEGGHIHDVSYAIDDGPMRVASPKDGIYDGASEAFEVVLPAGLSKGPHRLVLRARDSFGNMAHVAVVVRR